MELRNLHYFREISAIPRKSFHEEKIADYLEAFARTHGLWHTAISCITSCSKSPEARDGNRRRR